MGVIAESLRVNGQYKPIVVQEATGLIIAGAHTWKAAKALGWERVAVTLLDVNDAEALEIMLADNRSSDTSYTDPEAATSLLATLDTLEGTGYTIADLSVPASGHEYLLSEDSPVAAEPDTGPLEGKLQPFVVGRAKGCLRPGVFEQWRATLPKKNADALAVVLMRLGMESVVAPAPSRTIELQTEMANVGDLIPYPGNPRQGDVGLLIQLLERHGQYRPIVVSKRTNFILAGNHVARAAAQLGWAQLAVVYVDVDADAEKRILLVDNRSSDLATYDQDALGAALAALGHVEGTGFTLDDLDEVLSGHSLRPEEWRGGEMPIRIGALKTKVTGEAYRAARLTVGSELAEAAALLGIEVEAVL